jgi:hypothetical protein
MQPEYALEWRGLDISYLHSGGTKLPAKFPSHYVENIKRVT